MLTNLSFLVINLKNYSNTKLKWLRFGVLYIVTCGIPDCIHSARILSWSEEPSSDSAQRLERSECDVAWLTFAGVSSVQNSVVESPKTYDFRNISYIIRVIGTQSFVQ